MIYSVYFPIGGPHVTINPGGSTLIDPIEYSFSRTVEADDLNGLGGYLNDVVEDEDNRLWFRTIGGWIIAEWIE